MFHFRGGKRTMRKTWLTSALLIVLSLVTGGFATAAYAQFSSNVQGVVSDSSGAVVPGVTILLTNTDTKVAQTTATGSQGEFRFVSLAPGPYEITASAKGFTTHKVLVQLLTEQTM